MALFEDGYYLFDNDVNAIVMALFGMKPIRGCEVSAHPSGVLAVSVSAGACVVGTYSGMTEPKLVSIASLSITADGTYPRKALVYVGTDGVADIELGTAASAIPAGLSGKYTQTPIPPDIDDEWTPIAEVYIPAGATGSDQLTIHNYEFSPQCGEGYSYTDDYLNVG